MVKEHLPNKLISAAFLAATVYACGGKPVPAPAPENSSSFTPVPTEIVTPEPTYPPMGPVPTVVYPTPEPTADPKIRCDSRLVKDAQIVEPIEKEPSKSFKLNVPVLEYHRIVNRNEAGLSHLKVPPSVFDSQMKALYDNGWHSITAAQLAYDLEHEITPDPKTFVVTFDDGYIDGYTNAMPILQKYGFVGTFFVITGRVGGSLYVTKDDLKQMTLAGMEIANHTDGHNRLTSGNANTHVDKAELFIAETTDIWSSTIAYPFGSENGKARTAVAGCTQMRMAFIQDATSGPRAIETWNNRWEVPRIKIYPGTSPKTLLQILTPYKGK